MMPAPTHQFHSSSSSSSSCPSLRFQQGVRQAFGIQQMPTFVFFRNGQQTAQFSGADATQLEATIQQGLHGGGGEAAAAPDSSDVPGQVCVLHKRKV